MTYYAGLDVSLKETFISIIDSKGLVVKEAQISSDVSSLASYLRDQNYDYDRIGIESGQLSIALCKGLKSEGFPVICVDARHMSAALSARVNKNDRNDARGIAQMLRAGLYKEVEVKSDHACEEKVLLGSRRQLVNTRQHLMGTIRGLLKIYGLKISSQTQFFSKVREGIKKLSDSVILSIESLLSGLEGIESSLKLYDCSDREKR